MTGRHLDHLSTALGRLDVLLHRAVDRAVALYGAESVTDPFRGLHISQHDAAQLIATWDEQPLHRHGEEPPLLEVIDSGSCLARLAHSYGLSSFDLELVVIAIAPEVDLRYERLYAYLHDNVSRRRPTVDLALTLLTPTPSEKWVRRAHLASDAPLIRHRLITLTGDEYATGSAVLGQTLELDGPLVRHLLGQHGLDPALRAFAEIVWPTDDLDEVGSPAVHGPLALVRTACDEREPLHLYFGGRPSLVKKQTALALAATVERPLITADLGYAPLAEEAWERAVHALFREAELHEAILYLEPCDALLSEDHVAQRRRLLRALTTHEGIAVLAGTPGDFEGADLLSLDFPIPDRSQRRMHWQRQVPGASEEDLDILAGRFRLTIDQIHSAAALATKLPSPGTQGLFKAARAQSGTTLAGLADKVRPIRQWGDLVLPDDTQEQLREICRQVVHRHRVLDEWGFGARMSLGRGVSALFSGASGTGKTTAAEIVAGELGLDLYKIDLSRVVSKYIGDTEKNLQRVFAAAEDANAILFFDEADALFGKRSEVRDSHDRYANVEIAYLLQRMEHYEGVAILSTNLRQNMDEAFTRRLQFAVEFPFPDEEQRAEIWRIHFPPEAPRDTGVDLGQFARQFRISGGNIRNIVLGAAYLAADEDCAIATRHLLRAVIREHQKSGKVLAAEDLEPFAEAVHA